MTQKSTIFLCLAFALASVQPLFAQDSAAATVVATVNGTDITLGNMIIAHSMLPAEYQSLPDDLVFGGLLDQLIQQVVIEHSFQDKLKLVDELTLLNDRRTYLASVLVADVAAQAATDQAIQAAYDAAYAAFKSQTEYRAAHILVDSEASAKDLLAQLDAGADFAALAAENSTDGSAQAGGDLGWFGLGMMVEPFETAVVAAEVGKVVGPVQTEFGYHLILVTETRNSEKPPLDQVRADIEAELQRSAVLAKVQDMVAAAAVTKTDVTIDPALLKDRALLDK